MIFAQGTSGLEYSDWVAGLAVVISLFSVYLATRTDKVNRLSQMHLILLEHDVQQGRRYLYETWESGGDFSDLKRNRPDEWALVNRALVLYDALGYYYSKDWLPSGTSGDSVMDLWATPITEISEPALAFIRFRDDDEGWPDQVERWPYLKELIERARAHSSS